MAEIFLARVSGLPGFQKMVVIKRILPQLASKTDFVEMFLDEARIAATLQHPNVVQMYDVGVVDGNYFIAMEYLHGEDVRSIMKALFKKEEKLPLEHALNIMIGVCSGLHYAHEKVGFDGKPLNIVHRDVTPQNIIVTYEGGVKLLDFGIAKASNRFGETRFGTLKGKVPYMSPEQCRGETLDRRSDVFSLGIMMYELSLGKRLYKGASDFEILKQIVEGTVTPPHEVDPGYNPALEKIVMKALEKDPTKRWQTAREVQAELESLVREGRLYVSPIALQGFMEHVFGQKIEAWREAQASGKSLGEHLQEIPAVEGGESLEIDELEEIDEEAAKAEESARAERAALRKAIEQSQESFPSLDDGTGGSSASGAERSRASVSVLLPQGQVRKPLLVLALGLAVILGVAGWKLLGRHPEPPPPPIAVAPQPVPPPKPEPAVEKPPPPTPVGIARVKTTPPGATLYLDGKKLEAQSPATLDDLPVGQEHILLAQVDGYDDKVVKFEVAAGEVKPVDVVLTKPPTGVKVHHEKRPPRPASPKAASPAVATPAPSPAPEPPPAPVKLEGEGTLVIASSPWCNVSIDGAAKGPTPVSAKVPAGKHTVVLTNPEFKISRTLSVMVMPNETVRKRLDFAQ
jgi:hypothetical protein